MAVVEAASPFDLLPNEIMFLILDKVNTSLELLLPCASVCKGWNNLCEALTLETLHIDCSMAKTDQKLHLLHAHVQRKLPGVRSLTCSNLSSSLIEPLSSWLTSIRSTLKVLNLMGASGASATMSPLALQLVLSCPMLEHLELAHWSITNEDGAVDASPGLRFLTFFKLHKLKISTKHLESFLALCPALKFLSVDIHFLDNDLMISSTTLDDLEFAHENTKRGSNLVLALPNLKTAKIDAEKIKGHAPALKVLDLSNCYSIDILVDKLDGLTIRNDFEQFVIHAAECFANQHLKKVAIFRSDEQMQLDKFLSCLKYMVDCEALMLDGYISLGDSLEEGDAVLPRMPSMRRMSIGVYKYSWEGETSFFNNLIALANSCEALEELEICTNNMVAKKHLEGQLRCKTDLKNIKITCKGNLRNYEED